jgi:hypothetical protein
MKKILVFFGLFVCLKSFGQFPVKQTLGSDSTLVESKGGMKSRMINKPFQDTTQANLQRIKFYDGSQIYTNSGGGALWLRDSAANKWVPVGGNFKSWFGLTKSGDSTYGGGLVPGVMNYWVPNNFDPALKGGLIRLVNIQNSDSINGYGPFTGGRFLQNEGLQNNDATYSPSMFAATRILAEEFGDTARSQYGGIISLFQRRVLDSTASIFGPSATKKYFANSGGGVFVTNQLFPPKDSTDIFAGPDGHSSSSFESNWGFGGSWGYNVHVISGVPGYPLNSYSAHTDLQREASRTRMDHATGNGFSAYVADWRRWQQPITPSDNEVGHYISKVADYTSIGSTDWNLSSGGATKAKILAVSKVDSAFGFHSLPKWRVGNEVYNGYSMYMEGDSDLAHIDGKLSVGGALPTHPNGLWNDYKLTVRGDGDITGSMWFNPQTGRIVGSGGTPTLGSPGTFYIIAADTSVFTYLGQLDQKGANIKITGNNTSDAVRGGIDLGVHWGQSATAPVRIKFQNFDGSQENRYLFRRDKFYAEVKDSVSFQAPAYKFAGVPTGVQQYVLMQDANGYIYKRDSSSFVGAIPSLLQIFARDNYAPVLTHSSSLDASTKNLTMGGVNAILRLNDSTGNSQIIGRRLDITASAPTSTNGIFVETNALTGTSTSQSLLLVNGDGGSTAGRLENGSGGYGITVGSNVVKIDTTTYSAAVRATMRGYVAKTGTYTAAPFDHTIEATSGTFTITLPTAVGIAGKQYVVTNSGAGTVTLGTTSSQTFVNVTATPTTLTLNQFNTVIVESNGTNWLRISNL